MAWRIKFRPSVLKELATLPRQTQDRILSYLESLPGNPRLMGKAMKAGKHDPSLWRYRVGKYRVVCHLRDGDSTVLVLRIGHGKEVYR